MSDKGEVVLDSQAQTHTYINRGMLHRRGRETSLHTSIQSSLFCDISGENLARFLGLIASAHYSHYNILPWHLVFIMLFKFFCALNYATFYSCGWFTSSTTSFTSFCQNFTEDRGNKERADSQWEARAWRAVEKHTQSTIFPPDICKQHSGLGTTKQLEQVTLQFADSDKPFLPCLSLPSPLSFTQNPAREVIWYCKPCIGLESSFFCQPTPLPASRSLLRSVVCKLCG